MITCLPFPKAVPQKAVALFIPWLLINYCCKINAAPAKTIPRCKADLAIYTALFSFH